MKKILVSFLLIFILILFTGCKIINQEDISTGNTSLETNTILNSTDSFTNDQRETWIDMFNLSQGQIIENNGWLYYPGDFDESGVSQLVGINENTNKRKIISEDEPIKICLEGDWIYYEACNYNLSNIYRIKTDGTSRTQVYVGGGHLIGVINGWVYFTDDNWDNLFRVKIDGTEMKELVDANCFSPCISDNYIFFISWNNGNEFKRINLDGSDCVTLYKDKKGLFNDMWIDSFLVYNNLMLFSAGSNVSGKEDVTGMYLLNEDGTELSKLINGAMGNINSGISIQDKNIYFISVSYAENQKHMDTDLNTYTLNVYDLNTGTQQSLFAVDSDYIGIVGNWLYYQKGGFNYIRTNLSTNTLQKLE